MASLYRISLTELKGIGKKRADLFANLGINSVGDLINYYPKTYEDWTNPQKISDLQVGSNACIKGCIAMPVANFKVSGGRIISKTAVCDNSGHSISIVFFNNKYISTMLSLNNEYFFYGKITEDKYGLQMISPVFCEANGNGGIHPVYRLTAGISNFNIKAAVKQALEMLPKEVKDPFSDNIRNRFNLVSLDTALRNIHFPSNSEELAAAKKRLVTEELVVLNLGMRSLKEHNRGVSSVKITEEYSQEFLRYLPFKMTNAQMRAISDCTKDMLKNIAPMNRLVQGDVGSGKTVVAASVCYTTVKNGFQAAFMAPTEILARQHFKTFCDLFKNTDIKIGLLTGALKESEKKKIRQQLANGEIDIIIGTHALITDKTEFSQLGLAVTDEQHRFGVAQRAKLLGKGNNPHLLVMSATPIPRTLGLIIFGDLDISVIDELPPLRKPVKTVHFYSNQRGRVYNFICKEVEQGRQAYIVCPLVDEGELENVVSAEQYTAELMLHSFADISVGLVHGQMPSSEKDEVMRKFASGEISVLVATTVIEVGVDVPNASVIMIENAERFGLSQLHQLRGRVGRGSAQSYCILVSDKDSERLDVMCSTNDGFKIADEDLRMRGPGDFFGKRQHGLPQMAIADFADTENLELSQKISDYIMFVYKDLRCDELRLLRAEVDRLFARGGHNSLN